MQSSSLSTARFIIKNGKIVEDRTARIAAKVAASFIFLASTAYLATTIGAEIRQLQDIKSAKAAVLISVQSNAVPADHISKVLARWITSQNPSVAEPFAEDVVSATLKEAYDKRVDPTVLLAIMYTESRFDFRAVSKVGAIGLMQVLPSVHSYRVQNVSSLYDPKVNIHVGVTIFSEFLKIHNGNINRALLSYNGVQVGEYHNKVLQAKQSIDQYIAAHYREI